MIVSDDAASLVRLFGVEGEAVAVSALPEVDRRIWQRLCDRKGVYGVEGDGGFWHRVFLVTQAGASQFDVLRELAATDPDLALDGPVACLALSGRGFHGHRNRSWFALPGNLHLSVAIPCRLSAAEAGIALTMLPAVAVVEAVARATDDRVVPGIKWVNDILLGGHKVAGVLTATGIQGGRIDRVVLGVGINVAVAPRLDPTPFVPVAGCLRGLAPEEALSLPRVLGHLLDALARRYRELEERGGADLLECYRTASLVLGEPVRIWEEGLAEDVPVHALPEPMARGVVIGMDADLGLRLAGREDVVRRGRLAFESSCRALGL